MSKILEIEVRYTIDKDSLDSIIDNINNLNFYKINSIQQEDIYYTSKYVDFIESEECLRIRTTDDKSEITWKPPSNSKMKRSDFFWKEEVDLAINNQREQARKLFRRLKFIEYCIVKKDRAIYVRNDGVEISLDYINSLGYFIEIEVKSSELDIAKKNISSIVEGLGLESSSLCKIPYRDLVVKSKQENKLC